MSMGMGVSWPCRANAMGGVKWSAPIPFTSPGPAPRTRRVPGYSPVAGPDKRQGG